MATIKVYLYCVKAGEKLVRYSKELFEKELDFGDEQDYEGCCNELGLDPNKHYHVGKGFGEKNRLLVSGDEGYYMLFDKPLNGTICFECEIEKAEKIVVAPFPFANGDYQYASKTLTPDALEVRSCLSVKELNDYDPRHALYLKNVKAIKPFPITGVARRDPTHLNLAEGIASGMFRAPQNMCWARAWNDEERKWERVLVLSLRPKNLCNIANGLKDIETRRVVVKEIKEMEK